MVVRGRSISWGESVAARGARQRGQLLVDLAYFPRHGRSVSLQRTAVCPSPFEVSASLAHGHRDRVSNHGGNTFPSATDVSPAAFPRGLRLRLQRFRHFRDPLCPSATCRGRSTGRIDEAYILFPRPVGAAEPGGSLPYLWSRAAYVGDFRSIQPGRPCREKRDEAPPWFSGEWKPAWPPVSLRCSRRCSPAAAVGAVLPMKTHQEVDPQAQDSAPSTDPITRVRSAS